MRSRIVVGAAVGAICVAVLVGTAGIVVGVTPAPEKLSPPTVGTKALTAEKAAAAQKLLNGGVKFLLASREADGGWSMGGGANKPAVTAMVLKVLLQHPDFDSRSPIVAEGFAALMTFRQKDGGFYDPRAGLQNYTTALAIVALVAAKDPKYRQMIDDAVTFMKKQQIVAGSESPDGEKIAEDHPFFGGVSYGQHGRPDLSNLGMWMEALHDAGLSGDDPAFKNALVFLTRTQNRSESNPMVWAKQSSNDGGFVYASAVRDSKATGESKAGAEGQGLRSYGSMTYVGFKSMLYANVDRNDGRVQDAFKWIRRYWRLDSNPNMPAARSLQGLYYYYHVFAKALRAWGADEITDTKGRKHNWRAELIDVLAGQVRKDGSWLNEASRWQEGSPVLVTCYVVLALQEALK